MAGPDGVLLGHRKDFRSTGVGLDTFKDGRLPAVVTGW
jgi:hypothetical protein